MKNTMDLHTAFSTLAVEAGSAIEVCKAAYRRLISQWHPDRNPHPDASSKTQLINQAWERIQSSTEHERQSAGDRGAARPDASGEYEAKQRPHHHWFDEDFNHGYDDGFRERYKPPGKDINRTVKATIEEINEGFIYQFKATIKEPCSSCFGSKCGPPVRCHSCNGLGFVRDHWSRRTYTCHDCDGTGTVFEKCTACKGKGTQSEKPVTRKIRIPPGLRDNTELVVTGLGHPSVNGGKNGNLNLTIRIEPHRFFSLLDEVLAVSVPVTRLDLMCGAPIKVPTLYGFKTLDLASYKGTLIELPEAGLRGRDGSIGPLLVLLEVVEQPIEGHAMEILRSAYEMMKRQGLEQPEEIAAWKTLVSQPDEAPKTRRRRTGP